MALLDSTPKASRSRDRCPTIYTAKVNNPLKIGVEKDENKIATAVMVINSKKINKIALRIESSA